MKVHTFVKAKINGYSADITNQPRYTMAQGDAPRKITVGDGTNRPLYLYDPANEVVLEFNPATNKNFIELAAKAQGDDSGQLQLVDNEGKSLGSVILEVIKDNQLLIRVQPIWWL